jgi:hypothetical protein
MKRNQLKQQKNAEKANAATAAKADAVLLPQSR